MTRGVSKKFTDAMREKLDYGRLLGRDSWETRQWEGQSDGLFGRLIEEMNELRIAVLNGNKADIRREAADVANFAMMIADAHGALSDD